MFIPIFSTHAVCIIIYICNDRISIRGQGGFCSTKIPCVRSVKRDSSTSNGKKKPLRLGFPHIPPPHKTNMTGARKIHHEWWTKMHSFHMKNGGIFQPVQLLRFYHQGMAQGFTALHAVPMFGRSNPSSARTVHLLMSHRCDATWRVAEKLTTWWLWWLWEVNTDMDVSLNGGFSPQIIHLNRVFHINHPFWGTPILGNLQIDSGGAWHILMTWEI